MREIPASVPDAIRVALLPGSGQPVGGAWSRANWLPFVGPTAFCVAVELAHQIADARATIGSPLAVDLAELGRRVGVSARSTRRRREAPLEKALVRLTWFGLARWDSVDDIYQLRLMWPEVPARVINRPQRAPLAATA